MKASQPYLCSKFEAGLGYVRPVSNKSSRVIRKDWQRVRYKVTQLVKCLPCKNETLSLTCKNHVKRKRTKTAHGGKCS